MIVAATLLTGGHQGRPYKPYLELWKQEPGVAAVLVELFPELCGQNRFFSAPLDPIGKDDRSESCNASPFVYRQGSADRGEKDPGVDRVPEASIRAGADELMILLESDSAAPILPQVPACPQGESDSNPSERYSCNRGYVGTMEYALTENSDVHEAAEQQDEAGNFQRKMARSRDKGL